MKLYQRVLPRECCLWLTSNTQAITVREFHFCEKSPQKGGTSVCIYPRTTLPWSKNLKNQQKFSTYFGHSVAEILFWKTEARTRRVKTRRTVGRLSTKMNLTLLYAHRRLTIKDSTLCEQQFIYLFSMDLRSNSNYLSIQHYLISF